MNNLNVSPFRLSRDSLLMKCAAPVVEHLFSLRALEKHYAQLPSEVMGSAFIDEVFSLLNIQVKSMTDVQQRIPNTGATIVVANHPFGAIDGMALAQQIFQVRDDVKFMANYHLSRVKNMREMFIPVDPFGNKQSPKRNVGGLREAIKWIKSGGLLIVFPAGEVSQWSFSKNAVKEPSWSSTIGRLVRLTQAKVVPAFIAGKNSKLFYLCGLLHPMLRTAMLPREVANKANSSIEIYFGGLINPKALNVYQEDVSLIDCLRAHTLRLPVQENAKINNADQAQLASGPAKEKLAVEIASLGVETLLVDGDELQVYAVPAQKIPLVLQEIGRLREIAFRAVGEGTGKATDIDMYDNYYYHLFIWDKVLQQVVGAYRLGLSEEILPRYGKKGFYTYSLFDYRTRFIRDLGPSIELGRSFVRLEYQKEFSPLMLLWRGIGEFVVRRPQYKTLFGPVSISSAYHDYSQRLMVEYLRKHHFDFVRAKQVKARAEFIDDSLSEEFRSVLQWADMSTISRLVAAMEDDGKGMPILVRQYLKLGGRMAGFNIDADFSNSLDALVIVDLSRAEQRSLQRYMGKQGARQFLQYHQEDSDVNCLQA